MPPYTFESTEINNKKGSELETKSLLYLMGIHKDCGEVELVAVDCFNDVTGISEDFEKLWDVQSKNHAYLPPSKIGESLYTLYGNYISSLEFYSYILFVPKIDRRYLVDGELHVYGYDNIRLDKRPNIERKLIEKIKSRLGIESPPLLHDFLNLVEFVED